MKPKMTLTQTMDRFSTEEACKQYLQERRWPSGVQCPRCKSTKVYALKAPRLFHWVCKNKGCGGRNGYRFSVISKTIFENTNYPLKTWFQVIYLMLQSKKGISALQVQRVIARATDLYNLYRRRRRMSLAASMQWDLLPPLVLKAGKVTVAGLVEPAYDVGGDCFDYAVNGPVLDVAIIDAMGHGLGSAVISSLAMGCYRHDRREGRSLEAMHTGLAATIASRYSDHSFATGLLGRIDLDSGNFAWTNAGHPRPLLIRNGQVVSELVSKPTPPWGIAGANPTVATENLEPGDCLLLYTDGVTEGRTAEWEFFGVDRLIDLTNRYASDLVRPEKVLRQIVARVREHQRDELGDDATVVIVRWDGPSS